MRLSDCTFLLCSMCLVDTGLHNCQQRLSAAVTRLQPALTLAVWAAGLFVPSSDVDVVVMNTACIGNSQIKAALYKLSQHLRKQHGASNINVRPHARPAAGLLMLCFPSLLELQRVLWVTTWCSSAGWCVQVIAKAKVPIIKFREAVSGFDFDVSMEVPDGPVAGEFVAQLMAELPPMRPLILVLKIFLQQREFNEVWHLQSCLWRPGGL